MTRSAVNQTVQIGKETTFGTSVAATQKLVNIGIQLGIKADAKPNVPLGMRQPTSIIRTDEMAEGKADGTHSYSEFHYFANSLFGAATITAGTGSTGANPTGTSKWLWKPATSGSDPAPVSYTIEQGDSLGAMKATGVFTTGLGYELATDDLAKFSAELVGNQITTGNTLTASPTTRPNVPVLPGETCVYLNDTFATIGTTKLDAATGELFSLKYEHKSRKRSDRTINCDPAAPRAMVDLAADVSLELVIAANSWGENLLAKFRNGQTFFLSIVSTSATAIGVTTGKYKLTHNLAVQIADPGFGEEKDKWAATYKLQPVHDGSFGGAESFELITDLAAA